MIRKTYLFAFLIAFLGVALFFRYFLLLQPSDYRKYQKFLQKKQEITSKDLLKNQEAHQTREKVQKDFWKEDKHFRLSSLQSELFLAKRKEKIEAIEKLYHLQCQMEMPGKDFQEIRKIDAEEGSFSFPSQKLETEKVSFRFFHLPNLLSKETPPPFPEAYLTGTAQEMAFLLQSQAPFGGAKNFSINFAKERTAQKTSPTHFSSDSVKWDKETLILSGNVFCITPMGEISSKFAYVEGIPMTEFFKGKELLFSHIHFQEKVFLKSLAPSFILKADEVDLFDLPEIPKIQAKQNIEILFPEKNASLTCKGTLKVEGDLLFLQAAEKESLIYKDDEILCSARQGFLIFCPNSFQVEKIVLENEVRIITNKGSSSLSYGTADTLSFLCAQDEFILSATSPKKVLFWQKENSLCLKAPEVAIHHAKEKNREVQGRGDVHFSLTLEEENQLHNIFSSFILTPNEKSSQGKAK